MQSLLASFTCSHACHLLSILLLSMQSLLASITCCHACLVFSVLFLSMQSLLASFICSHGCHVLLFCSFLCNVCSLVSIVLMVAMCFLFCSHLRKVSDALFLSFCNLSLAFVTDLTLSDCNTRFHGFVSQIMLCSSFGSKYMFARFTHFLPYWYNSFTLRAHLTLRHS